MSAKVITLSMLFFATICSSSVFAQSEQTKTPELKTEKSQIFNFLGYDTETISSISTINGSPCTFIGPKTSCEDYNAPVIAGRPMRWLDLDFYEGKLYSVNGAFGKYAFDDLLSAFTEKYGTPILMVEKWQAKSGAIFDNDVAVWNFKGGILKLSRLGVDINSGIFEFSSIANAPPASKPRVDF